MDTGRDSFTDVKDSKLVSGLQPSEINWHQHQLASAGDRRVILFSHHQLFTASRPIGGESWNRKLKSAFEPQLTNNRLSAWYWGHEHVLQIFDRPDPAENTAIKGRCIGNSGLSIKASEEHDPYAIRVNGKVPRRILRDPGDPSSYIRTSIAPPAPDKKEGTFRLGYTILELGSTSAAAHYYEVDLSPNGAARSELVFYEDLALGYR